MGFNFDNVKNSIDVSDFLDPDQIIAEYNNAIGKAGFPGKISPCVFEKKDIVTNGYYFSYNEDDRHMFNPYDIFSILYNINNTYLESLHIEFTSLYHVWWRTVTDNLVTVVTLLSSYTYYFKVNATDNLPVQFDWQKILCYMKLMSAAGTYVYADDYNYHLNLFSNNGTKELSNMILAKIEEHDVMCIISTVLYHHKIFEYCTIDNYFIDWILASLNFIQGIHIPNYTNTECIVTICEQLYATLWYHKRMPQTYDTVITVHDKQICLSKEYIIA